MPDNPILHAALNYAGWGWHVLPLAGIRGNACICGGGCESPGKHPFTRNGLLDATCEPEQIRNWFLRRPNLNVGVATGPSGLVVADIDQRKGGLDSLRRLRLNAQAPGRADTGGGFHLYYQGSAPSTVGRLGPGVDVRGVGGYVVAPPSTHWTGRQYKWVRLPNPLPSWPMPEPLVKEPPAVKGPILEGRRNDALFSLGSTLRYKGLEADVIRVALLAVNREVCRPPLSDAEVEDIAGKVNRRPREGPGLRALRRQAGGP